MKADDRYRLAPMRDARGRDERVKRVDLAAAVGDARTVEVATAAIARRVELARDALARAVVGRNALADGAAARRALADRHVTRRRRQLDDALAEHARAEVARGEQQGAVDAARRRLATARADREVIERHFARWRDARKKLAEQRED